MMLKQLLLVGFGGGLGSITRFLASWWINKYATSLIFPLATFLVNVSGCFLIGLFLGWAGKSAFFSEELKFLLIVGFCGGYTTFSTFSSENMRLLEEGNYLTLASYVTLSLLGGLFALWVGNLLSKI